MFLNLVSITASNARLHTNLHRRLAGMCQNSLPIILCEMNRRGAFSVLSERDDWGTDPEDNNFRNRK